MINYVCSKCHKDFNEGQHPGYFILFDKCRGKFCPDCGKTRRVGEVKCLYENLNKPGSEGRSLFRCERCLKMTEYFFDGICQDCFCKVQEGKGGCVCPFRAMKQDKFYHCSFCEEFHSPFHAIICKKCAEKQDSQNTNTQKEKFFNTKLPFMLGGIIIGLFIGWLLFVALRKKNNKNKGKKIKSYDKK